MSFPIEIESIEIFDKSNPRRAYLQEVFQDFLSRAVKSGLLYGFQGAGQVVSDFVQETSIPDVKLESVYDEEVRNAEDLRERKYEILNPIGDLLGFVFVRYYKFSRMMDSTYLYDNFDTIEYLFESAVNYLDGLCNGRLTQLAKEVISTKNYSSFTEIADLLNSLLNFKRSPFKVRYFRNMRI